MDDDSPSHDFGIRMQFNVVNARRKITVAQLVNCIHRERRNIVFHFYFALLILDDDFTEGDRERFKIYEVNLRLLIEKK